MPRKRMIDPGIWTNIQVTRLSVLQRLLCVGLVSNADDDGRLNGDPLYLKGIIFPHDNITPQAIEDQLKQIARQSLIVRYRVNKTRCIYLPDWSKPGSWCYQYIRERRPSTIPPPPSSTPPPTPPPTPLSTPPPTLKQQQSKLNQSKTIQPNPTQPNPDESLSAGWKLLLSVGVAKTKAYSLASNHPYQRIKSVCQYAKGANNPAGLIIKTLDRGWQVSKGGDKQ